MTGIASFRSRATLFLWLSVIAALSIPAWHTRNALMADMTREAREDLARCASMASLLLEARGRDAQPTQEMLDQLGQELELKLTLLTDAEAAGVAALATGGPDRTGSLYAIVPLKRDPSSPPLALKASQSKDVLRAKLDVISRQLLIAFGASLALAGILGTLAIRRLDSPIQEMVQVAEELGKGHYHRRLGKYSSKEFKVLSHAFNTMAQHIEAHVETITHQKSQLEAVLDGMREGVMVLDAKGHIRQVNSALASIFPDIQARIGRHPIEAIPSPALQKSCERVLDKGRKGSPCPASFQVELEDDQVYDVNIVSLQEGENGLGAVVVFHDITKLSRLERVRRDFVANVSHELRTPLTSIKGYAETIATMMETGNGKPEAIQGFLEIILRNANHMAKMVNDLLSLTRLEGESKGFDIQPLNPAEPAQHALKECYPLVKDKDFHIHVDLPEQGLRIMADSGRLTQVFRNLLENAITHGGSGKDIHLSHTIEKDKAIFTVADQGPGIPREEQKRIFERFYRVEKHRSKNHGGSSGLGLAISKHIVEKMGGTIWVTSPAAGDKGAAFSFSLPLANSPQPPVDEQSPESTSMTS